MRSMSTILAALLIGAILSGCAYKPLKAPCAPDEGVSQLGYAATPNSPAQPAPTPFDRCGPMRPI